MNKHFFTLLFAFALTLISCRKEDEFAEYADWQTGTFSEIESSGTAWIYGYPSKSGYRVGIDTSVVYSGARSAFIASTSDTSEFASISTIVDPKELLGKQVTLTCSVRSEDVKGWAGVWYRVDKIFDPKEARKTENKVVDNVKDFLTADNSDDYSWEFKNMSDDPIRGTTDWKQYTFTFNVPKETGGIQFGVLLSGKGKVWVDSFDYTTDSLKSDSSKARFLGFETVRQL